MYQFFQVSAYGDQVVSLQKSLATKGTAECGEDGSTLSSFRALADILLSLTNKDGVGRIIISRGRPASLGQQGGYLKYVMLSGEKIFSEVCRKFTHYNMLEFQKIIISPGFEHQPWILCRFWIKHMLWF